MALEVTLSDQQDQALRGYLATLVRDEIDRVRDDEKLNMLVYTRKNLAKACGISPATVDKWQKLGLKAAYVGNTPYYTADAVKSFFKERTM